MDRCARPGAEKIKATGIVAVTDDNDKIRILLTTFIKDAHFRSDNLNFWPEKDGIIGELKLSIPLRYKKYWLQRAIELRGKTVTVEASVRNFLIPMTRGGTAFDLISMESN